MSGAFDKSSITRILSAIPGVKRVQVETVVEVIVETECGRDEDVIDMIHNAEIQLIKQNTGVAFDFSILYGSKFNTDTTGKPLRLISSE